jgi:hypothetical protein
LVLVPQPPPRGCCPLFSEGLGRLLTQTEEDLRIAVQRSCTAEKTVDGVSELRSTAAHAAWADAAKMAAAGIDYCPKELNEESLRHVTAKDVILTVGKRDVRNSIPSDGK